VLLDVVHAPSSTILALSVIVEASRYTRYLSLGKLLAKVHWAVSSELS